MNNSIKAAAKTMAAVIAAGAMAVAPVAGTINFGAMTAMAAEKSDDKGTISVSNVGSGATVKGYQIVKAQYAKDDSDNEIGFEKWVLSSANSIKDTTNYLPTVTEMQSLVAAIKQDTTHATFAQVDLKYDATSQKYVCTTAPAGEYLVLVEANGADDLKIYNPMVVSTSYKNGALTTNGLADASTKFTSGSESYAKTSEIDIEKKITNPDGKTTTAPLGAGDLSNGLADADDLQVGDTGEFRITTQIPGYSSAYSNLVFTITDTQDEAFNSATEINVYVSDTQYSIADADKVTPGKDYILTNTERAADTEKGVTALDSNDFEVAFTSSFIASHTGKYVTITYKAALNDKADKTAFTSNDDDVKLTYTNNIVTGTGHKEDKVREYSFPLTILKKGVDNDSEKLPGATFKLTRGAKSGSNYAAATDSTWTKVTDTNGMITFENLDEGTYTLKETAAPTGYSINPATYTITITPTYDQSGTDMTGGTLQSYKISITSDNSSETFEDITISATSEERTAAKAVVVNDTKMSGLPSTGARSALILTIAGIAVMIAVMAASRRKKIAD